MYLYLSVNLKVQIGPPYPIYFLYHISCGNIVYVLQQNLDPYKYLILIHDNCYASEKFWELLANFLLFQKLIVKKYS